ncbi:multicopper oxidase domain-containing protein [Rufibacter sp. LB8]|uniref:multicopper oxidase domain-containing protein n=2 Tax=Rufibacter sp. LB8 TaxID=2777781 RepID=UPI00178C40BB|nr:multicopper oxidase domain-containing protein [Rufibacter sp. LB8]
MANFTGKARMAIAVNGSIPAPTLTFNQGDTAIIRVHNKMKMETSVHWHGLLLPNEEDGVPYLNTAPILPGQTHTFTFPLIQSGTYWYHSHTGVQEQAGLYGSIVIKRPEEPPMKEYVLLLSDWTDENPHQVLRYLKRGAEWYSIRKGALQSYGEAIAAGYFKDKVNQEWKRMTPMDVADVYYDKFLVNGKEKDIYKDVQPGEKVKLRIINGASSSYFTTQFAGGPMQVVAADGINVMPVVVDKLELATAETYDVIVQIPAGGAYEFRATSWDVTGFSSVFLGDGPEVKAPTVPRLDYFAMMREMNQMMGSMDMSGGGMNMGNMKDMKNMQMGGDNHQDMGQPKKQPDAGTTGNQHDMGNMQGMQNNSAHGEMPGMFMPLGGEGILLTYDMLRSINPSTLDSTRKVREVKLTLTGNMLRYVWSFDNKTLSEADDILIRRGENVRFVMTNTTMMRHPMHLHGHFFRFVNAQGQYSPMKHTFDIKPMETVTIEFYANEEKDWFFHCHNLYHMMTGMARVVSYEGDPKNEFGKTGYKELKKEDKQLYSWFDLVPHTQGIWGNYTLSGNKYALEMEARASYKGDFEVENHVLRYIGNQQYLAAFIGFDYRNNKNLEELGEDGVRETNTKDNRRVFDAGFYYLLPMLVRSEWRIDHTGKLRLQLERRDLPLSNNFFADLRVNSDKEYEIGFRYMFSRFLSLSTNYDSDYGWGAGLTLHY